MEPEAAFRAVLEELQSIPNAADRAIAAEEIFGGASEKLAGIVNLTSAEFADLEKNVKATTDIWSQDSLDAAKDFDEALKSLTSAVTSLVTPLVGELLPHLTSFATWVTDNRPKIVGFLDQVKERAKPFFDAFVTGVKTVYPFLVELSKFIINNKPCS